MSHTAENARARRFANRAHDPLNRDPRDRSNNQKRCDHPACEEDGLHPAPKSRDRLRDYFWFCKPHAREYNAAWNYCAGLGQEEIDRIIRNDVVWNRPTWPLGMQKIFRHAQPSMDDPLGGGPFGGGSFGMDGDDANDRHPADEEAEAHNPDAWAMRILGLIPPVSLTEVKARYKEIVKKLHPDINGGDKAAEERLKEINRAYAYLKTSLSSLRPQTDSPA